MRYNLLSALLFVAACVSTPEDTGPDVDTRADTEVEPGTDPDSDTGTDSDTDIDSDTDEPRTPEICDNGLDDDDDFRVDCRDPDCADSELCVEDCFNGLDDDGDTLRDCNDPDCPACEVCTGGVDEDLDALVDCEDPDCFGQSACDERCDDAIDNDFDGLTDCDDDDCWGPLCDDHAELVFRGGVARLSSGAMNRRVTPDETFYDYHWYGYHWSSSTPVLVVWQLDCPEPDATESTRMTGTFVVQSATGEITTRQAGGASTGRCDFTLANARLQRLDTASPSVASPPFELVSYNDFAIADPENCPQAPAHLLPTSLMAGSLGMASLGGARLFQFTHPATTSTTTFTRDNDSLPLSCGFSSTRTTRSRYFDGALTTGDAVTIVPPRSR